MELDCTIAGVSQDMSLGENVTTTFLILRLPDGQQIRAAIDDAAAAAVVGMSVAQSGPPRAAVRVANGAPLPTAAPAPRVQAPSSSEPDPEGPSLMPAREWSTPETNGIPKAAAAPFHEDAPRIFGGQDEDDDDEVDPAHLSQPTEKPALVPGSNIQRTRGGRIVVPSKTVPKSEWGYPMTNAGGLDPETLTSSDNKNDDGVGSV
jgi:hypothetical protein